MNLRQNKGFGLEDAVIAVVILIIFTGIIASISYNIYLQSNFTKRNEQATNYIVELFEYANGLLYDNVNSDKMVEYINGKYKDKVKAINGKYAEGAQKQAPYTIYIDVTEVHESYVKQIEITTMYRLGGKNRTINMKTLVNK